MLPTIHAVFRDIPKFSRFPNVHNGRYGGHHHTKVPNRGRTSPMLVGRRGRRPGNDDALVKVLSPTGPLGTPFPTVLSAVGAPVALQTKHGVLDRPAFVGRCDGTWSRRRPPRCSGNPQIRKNRSGSAEGTPGTRGFARSTPRIDRMNARPLSPWRYPATGDDPREICVTEWAYHSIKCPRYRQKVWPTEGLSRARP